VRLHCRRRARACESAVEGKAGECKAGPGGDDDGAELASVVGMRSAGLVGWLGE
jgi:hypothetical protein